MLSSETWKKKFEPILDDAGEAKRFETFGEDFKTVKNTVKCMVWTEVEVDGKHYIVPGRTFVNRVNYFICQKPRRNKDAHTIVKG